MYSTSVKGYVPKTFLSNALVAGRLTHRRWRAVTGVFQDFVDMLWAPPCEDDDDEEEEEEEEEDVVDEEDDDDDDDDDDDAAPAFRESRFRFSTLRR